MKLYHFILVVITPYRWLYHVSAFKFLTETIGNEFQEDIGERDHSKEAPFVSKDESLYSTNGQGNNKQLELTEETLVSLIGLFNLFCFFVDFERLTLFSNLNSLFLKETNMSPRKGIMQEVKSITG